MYYKEFVNNFKKQKDGYLFVLPQMLLFIFFMVYPVFEGISMSFHKVSLNNKVWIGLQNYGKLFNDEVFVKGVVNTLEFVIAVTFCTVVLGLFISAAIYDKGERYISFIRGCFYLPMIVSMVVLSIVWKWLLKPADGLINYLICELGYDRINFLGNERYVIPVLIFIVIAPNLGQALILFIASMIGISRDLFESAYIDGASRAQNFWHIILPLINPTILYVIVITMINVIRVFSVIQLMTSGGPDYASTTMMFQVYEKAFLFSDMGSASAIGTIMFGIVIVLSAIQFKVFQRKI